MRIWLLQYIDVVNETIDKFAKLFQLTKDEKHADVVISMNNHKIKLQQIYGGA